MDQPFFLPRPSQSNTLHLELDAQHNINVFTFEIVYRGADKSLACPGRKQGSVSVRMA